METVVPAAGSGADKAKMTYSEFLEWADEDTHAEWVDGKAVPMSPVSARHQMVKGYLFWLVYGFVMRNRLGQVFDEPFQMKIGPDMPGRSPDIMFVASDHLERLRPVFLEGPADLVLEIVSPESRSRDRGEKFDEYERGGVREYWVIDPERARAEFHVLDAQGVFRPVTVDASGVYHSAILDGFSLNVNDLWQDPLPLPVD